VARTAEQPPGEQQIQEERDCRCHPTEVVHEHQQRRQRSWPGENRRADRYCAEIWTSCDSAALVTAADHEIADRESQGHDAASYKKIGYLNPEDAQQPVAPEDEREPQCERGEQREWQLRRVRPRHRVGLRHQLDTRVTSRSPFEDEVREKGAHWVKPDLVAQIGFTEWTRDGKLRHPRFLGLRPDKPAKDVVRERPQVTP